MTSILTLISNSFKLILAVMVIVIRYYIIWGKKHLLSVLSSLHCQMWNMNKIFSLISISKILQHDYIPMKIVLNIYLVLSVMYCVN